jgi:hypothetical protein
MCWGQACNKISFLLFVLWTRRVAQAHAGYFYAAAVSQQQVVAKMQAGTVNSALAAHPPLAGFAALDISDGYHLFRSIFQRVSKAGQLAAMVKRQFANCAVWE